MSSEHTFQDHTDLEEPPVESTDYEGDRPTRARLVALEAENEQLRREYSRAKRTQYRRTAVGLLLVGLLAIGGGVLFPDSREVLFALGGTGLFAGLLTFYLTPEQFIPADVGERIYAALAGNQEALVADLGLNDQRIYVPSPEVGNEAVRLFVPQHPAYELPDEEAFGSVFVVTAESQQRGLLLSPTGEALFDEFERASSGPLGEHPELVVEQTTDALIEQFELVDTVRTDIDAASGRASVGIRGSIYGPVDQFDHPAVSLTAVGLARQLDQPIEVQVDEGDDSRVDTLATYLWDTSDGTAAVTEDQPTADSDRANPIQATDSSDSESPSE